MEEANARIAAERQALEKAPASMESERADMIAAGDEQLAKRLETEVRLASAEIRTGRDETTP